MHTDNTPAVDEAFANTSQAWAEVGFEPWSKDECTITLPTNEQWNAYGAEVLPAIRMGHAIMFKSKDELVAAFRAIPEQMMGLVDSLDDIKACFEAYVNLIDGATARLLIAGSVAALNDEVTR